MKEVDEAARQAIEQSDRMIAHFRRAHEAVQPYLPITAENIEEAERLHLDRIDLVSHWFAKVQDMIGRRLFRTVFEVDYEDTPSTMADILAELEKRQLTTKEEWLLLRAIRNNIAHGYEQDAEEAAAFVMTAIEAVPTLLTVYDRVRGYILARARD